MREIRLSLSGARLAKAREILAPSFSHVQLQPCIFGTTVSACKWIASNNIRNEVCLEEEALVQPVMIQTRRRQNAANWPKPSGITTHHQSSIMSLPSSLSTSMIFRAASDPATGSMISSPSFFMCSGTSSGSSNPT